MTLISLEELLELEDIIEIFPAHLEKEAWRIELFGETVENIYEVDPLTGKKNRNLKKIKIYANSHYITAKPTLRSNPKNKIRIKT